MIKCPDVCQKNKFNIFLTTITMKLKKYISLVRNKKMLELLLKYYLKPVEFLLINTKDFTVSGKTKTHFIMKGESSMPCVVENKEKTILTVKGRNGGCVVMDVYDQDKKPKLFLFWLK